MSTPVPHSLRQALKERVVVADGGMGTMLQDAGPTPEDFQGHEGCNEIPNVTRPDIVRSVHEAYLAAGVDCVETNTFGANLGDLGEYGITHRIFELAEAGARIAREAADSFAAPDRPRWLIGSVAPSTKLPTLGQVTIERNGAMLMGSEIGAALTALEPLGLDLIGLDCATGPAEMSEHLRHLARHARAGLSPVGGRCGTTPEHLRLVVERVRRRAPRTAHGEVRGRRQGPDRARHRQGRRPRHRQEPRRHHPVHQRLRRRHIGIEQPVSAILEAAPRANVEQDLAGLYDGEVRYARDAFEGLRLMDAFMAVKRGERGASLPPLRERRVRRGATLDVTEPEDMPARSDAGHWGLKPLRGGDGPGYEELVETEGRPRLRMWLDRVQTEGLIEAGVVYGYFPAVSEGDDLVVLNEDGSERERFTFPHQRRDRFSLATRPAPTWGTAPGSSGCWTRAGSG